MKTLAILLIGVALSASTAFAQSNEAFLEQVGFQNDAILTQVNPTQVSTVLGLQSGEHNSLVQTQEGSHVALGIQIGAGNSASQTQTGGFGDIPVPMTASPNEVDAQSVSEVAPSQALTPESAIDFLSEVFLTGNLAAALQIGAHNMSEQDQTGTNLAGIAQIGNGNSAQQYQESGLPFEVPPLEGQSMNAGFGGLNAAGGLQFGDNNNLLQIQEGSGHLSLALQEGVGNQAMHTQTGSGHYAESIQNGAHNSATINQSGGMFGF